MPGGTIASAFASMSCVLSNWWTAPRGMQSARPHCGFRMPLTRSRSGAEGTVEDGDRASRDGHALAFEFDTDLTRSRRRLQPEKRCPSQSASPEWRQDRMRAAGHRIFRNTCLRGEEAGDEA